jgi:hypothetical protein
MGALCGICDQPAAAEIAPGKPLCVTCLAMPIEERRRAGLRRMMADESGREPFWHYLSFADERGFLGVCWVKARGIIDATRIADAHGCNPGGEVLCQALPGLGEPPANSAYVLHTDVVAIERMSKAWARSQPLPVLNHHHAVNRVIGDKEFCACGAWRRVSHILLTPGEWHPPG